MKNSTIALFIVLAILVAGAGGAAYYFYHQYTTLKNNPNQASQEETTRLINEVSKLMVLPSGEDPTIATVIDPAKLKDQKFFVNSKKNDKVLIYPKAQLAILYRESTNKIINVAPVNIGDNNGGTSTPTPTPTASPTPTEKPTPTPKSNK
jgi:hypothetical protein